MNPRCLEELAYPGSASYNSLRETGTEHPLLAGGRSDKDPLLGLSIFNEIVVKAPRLYPGSHPQHIKARWYPEHLVTLPSLPSRYHHLSCRRGQLSRGDLISISG